MIDLLRSGAALTLPLLPRLLRARGSGGSAAAGCTPLHQPGLVQESARHLVARGEHNLPRPAFKKAEAQFVSGPGDKHPDAWLARTARAEGLARLGRRREAAQLAREIERKAAPSIAPDGYWARRLAALSKQ